MDGFVRVAHAVTGLIVEVPEHYLKLFPGLYRDLPSTEGRVQPVTEIDPKATNNGGKN